MNQTYDGIIIIYNPNITGDAPRIAAELANELRSSNYAKKVIKKQLNMQDTLKR